MSAQKNNQKGFLTDSQIKEELLNDDLKALGINEDELVKMAIAEKQHLLAALKQSTSPHQTSQTKQQHQSPHNYENSNRTITSPPSSPLSSSTHPISYSKRKMQKNYEQSQQTQGMAVINKHSSTLNNRIENMKNSEVVSTNKPIEIALDSSEEFPSLSSSSGRNIKVPSTSVINIPHNVEEDEGEDVDMVDDDDDDEDRSNDEEECISEDDHIYRIPGYIDDDGCDLTRSTIGTQTNAKVRPLVDCYSRPFYSNNTKDTVKLMLKHYNAWHAAWAALQDQHPKLVEVSEKNIFKQLNEDVSIISTSTNDGDDNINTVEIDKPTSSSTFTSKSYTTPRQEDASIEKTPVNVKINIGTKAQTMPRDSRNRLQQDTPKVSQTSMVKVDTNKKWDPQSGSWASGIQGRNSLNNFEQRVLRISQTSASEQTPDEKRDPRPGSRGAGHQSESQYLKQDILKMSQTPSGSDKIPVTESWDTPNRTGTWSGASHSKNNTTGPQQKHQKNSVAASDRPANEKWDNQPASWKLGRQPNNNANNQLSYNNKPNELSKAETKVQCPICQLDFLQSKVESHAATCEGFPAETRSDIPYSLNPKAGEKSNRNVSSASAATGHNSSLDVMDLTDSNSEDVKQWQKGPMKNKTTDSTDSNPEEQWKVAGKNKNKRKAEEDDDDDDDASDCEYISEEVWMDRSPKKLCPEKP